jgi:lipopolysaccharide/colanic/teichoic acid biosynthesis glycosyltransferase
MELIDYILARVLRGNLHIWLIVFCAWSAVLAITQESSYLNSWLNLLFTFSSTVASINLLRSLNYFNSLRIQPRPSDVVTAMIALPIAGVIVDIGIRVVFQVSVARIIPIAIGGIFAGGALFLAHFFIGWLLIKSGTTLKVIFYTLPSERDLLVHELSLLGLSKHIEVLPPKALREHIYQRYEHNIDLIIISRGAATNTTLDATIIRAHLAGIPVVDFVELSNNLVGRVRLQYIEPWSFFTGGTPQTFIVRVFNGGKILLEPLIALVLLVILSPFLIIVALAIRQSSPGPIFFRQIRIGYLGRPFSIVKFRSMRTDAEISGPQWSSKNDERVTPLGRILRRTRIDEIPQLWNVVKGEMGFFGPRPERPEIYKMIQEKIPLFSMRTLVRPGITGWAQTFAGYAGSVEESRTKLEFDLYYIQHSSPRLDLIIAVKTVLVILFGDKIGNKVTPNVIKIS